MKFTTPVFRTLIGCFAFFLSVSAQEFNKDSVLQIFNAKGLKEKVKMAADLSPEDLFKLFPYIKDSLAVIKQMIYTKSNSNEGKFLLDIIDAKRESELHQYHKTVFILENALRFHTKDLDDSVRTFQLLGTSYMKLRNYNKAFEIEEIYERTRSRLPKEKQRDYIVEKSLIYLKLGLYSESVKQLRREFNMKDPEARKDSNTVGNFYNNIGVHFNRANLLDSAEYYFLKAKGIVDAKAKYDANKMYYTFFSALIDGNMASIFAKRKQYKEAIAPLKKDIYYSLKVNNVESAANSYNLIAQCYLELKQFDLAFKYIDTCKKILSRSEELTPAMTNMLTEAKYYSYTGNLKKAIDYYDRYIRQNDSLKQLDNETQLINQQVAFDLYQKENLLVEKEKIIQNAQLTNERERSDRAYLMSGIIVLLFAVLFLFISARTNRRRQTELHLKNKHIVQQKNTIEATLKEKEYLMKEIHHRVKNNLQIISSMLNLQSDKTKDDDLKEVLQESRQRINSMALIHQLLYAQNNMSNIYISGYLNTLIREIESTFNTTEKPIKTSVSCDDIQLNLDIAIPLGLIINELITNCYKHAFKNRASGLIEITLNKKDDHFTLIVKDNGSGFIPTQKEFTSLGMELIQILANQINGTLSFESNNGTEAKINFTA